MNGNRVQPRPHISHQNPSLGSFRGLAEVNKIHDSHLILLHKLVSGEAGGGFLGSFSVDRIISMPSGIAVVLDQDRRLLTRTPKTPRSQNTVHQTQSVAYTRISKYRAFTNWQCQ